MKNLSAFILFASAYLNLNAAVLTVSNINNSIAQYTTVAAAITAANNGDTIYIHASGTSYGSVSVSKQLVFIGSGAWPEGQNGQRSTLSSFSLGSVAASGTVIKGFNIVGSLAITTSTNNLDNVIVEQNRIQGSINLNVSWGGLSNWIIRNNLFVGGSIYSNHNNPTFTSISNFVVANNIFHGSGINHFAVNPSSSNNIFTNNIIYHPGSTSDNFLRLIKNTLITNNIIVGGANGPFNGIEDCTVSHNLFFGNYTSAAIANSSTQANNIFGTTQSPQFIEVSESNTMAYYLPNSPFTDFHLQSTSPAVGAGTNGIDLGIYTGPFPWMDHPIGGARRYYPGPRMPEIYEVITNGVAAPNSTIQINIKARNAY